MAEKIILLHGSDQVVREPKLSLGLPYNDYGQGFYCTLKEEMAKEWACKRGKDGYMNRYAFDPSGLSVLNLSDGTHSILHWIALLLKHRKFSLRNQIAEDARAYIIEQFSLDTSGYDVIVGYRADDSYFSYAESFVENGLPLRGLTQALYLGQLGEQTALVSEKAFTHIRFLDAAPVDKDIYYPKFVERDTAAREAYQRDIRRSRTYLDDIFVLDIMRERMTVDDARIQRIISQ